MTQKPPLSGQASQSVTLGVKSKIFLHPFHSGNFLSSSDMINFWTSPPYKTHFLENGVTFFSSFLENNLFGLTGKRASPNFFMKVLFAVFDALIESYDRKNVWLHFEKSFYTMVLDDKCFNSYYSSSLNITNVFFSIL